MIGGDISSGRDPAWQQTNVTLTELQHYDYLQPFQPF